MGSHHVAILGHGLWQRRFVIGIIAARAEQQFPDSNTGWDTILKSLQESVVGNIRPAVLTLTAAVGFVLLIAA